MGDHSHRRRRDLVQRFVNRPRRFTVDSSWWRYRSPQGDTVIAGSPVRLFRFASAASPILDRLEAGERTEEWSSAERHLVERLSSADAVHEQFDTSEISLDDVTIVIPARDPDDIVGLLASLPPARRIIVVDDGSCEPIDTHSGAEIHRLPSSIGPAGARNAGSAMVESAYVLFIDADIDLPATAREPSFWEPLLGHLCDQRVALVAPRVMSTSGTSALARYEMTDSPLDMGPRAARVHRGGPLSYVPSAVMAVRTSDLRRVGGFDAGMRYGEDVDLVWRLDDAGLHCRYEPSVVVHHRPRSTWIEVSRQRFHYGTSAADLETKHPGALAPVRLPAWTASAWAAALLGHPFIAVLAAAIPAFRLHDSLRSPDPARDAIVTARLVSQGHLLAGRGVAQAITRTWWPLMALASPFSRRVRWIWVLAVVVPGSWRWRSRHSRLDIASYLGARFIDDLTYGSGVWVGLFRRHRFGVLRPTVTLSRKPPVDASAS